MLFLCFLVACAWRVLSLPPSAENLLTSLLSHAEEVLIFLWPVDVVALSLESRIYSLATRFVVSDRIEGHLSSSLGLGGRGKGI